MAQGARKNLQLTLLLLLLGGCRTRPVGADLAPDGADLSSIASTVNDLAAAAAVDFAGACGGARCAADELCLYVNRGDCSMYGCTKIPSACRANPTCACLGTTLCPPVMNSEVFQCLPASAPLAPGGIECRSTLQCV